MDDRFHFGMSAETNDQTGEIMAVYFRLRKGRVSKTKECVEGVVFADYDRRGKLLGIEMLAPCRATVLDRIAAQPPAKKFVRNSIPRSMLVSSK